MGYVINGAKSTRDELKALDPAHVYSIDMMSAKDAKQFVDFTLDKPEILFATTDDSETGKKLKARIDKSMRSGVLAAAMNRASSANADSAPVAANLAYSVATTSSSNDAAPVVASTAYSVSTTTSSDAAPVAVVGVGNSSAVTVTGIDTKVKPITRVYITGSPATSVKINGKVAPMVKLNDIEIDTIRVKAFPKKNIVYLNKIRVNDETTIDGPGDKLIIVDGKQVKSLKNVSADDIQSISILKNETAEKRYGDKGKNGVIIITTKKGNK